MENSLYETKTRRHDVWNIVFIYFAIRHTYKNV